MAYRLADAKPLSEPMLEYCLIGPLGRNFNEISIDICTFSLKKLHSKMLSAKWRLFCLCLNLLTLLVFNPNIQWSKGTRPISKLLMPRRQKVQLLMTWRHKVLTRQDKWVIAFHLTDWTIKLPSTTIYISVTRSMRWIQSEHSWVERRKWSVQRNLSIKTTLWDTSLPSGAHLGGQGPPRWAPEGRPC